MERTQWMCKRHFADLKRFTSYQWFQAILELLYLENPAVFVEKGFDFSKLISGPLENRMGYISSLRLSMTNTASEGAAIWVKTRKERGFHRREFSEDSLDVIPSIDVIRIGLQEAYESSGTMKGPETPTIEGMFNWLDGGFGKSCFAVDKSTLLLALILDLALFPPAFFLDMDAGFKQRAEKANNDAGVCIEGTSSAPEETPATNTGSSDKTHYLRKRLIPSHQRVFDHLYENQGRALGFKEVGKQLSLARKTVANYVDLIISALGSECPIQRIGAKALFESENLSPEPSGKIG